MKATDTTIRSFIWNRDQVFVIPPFQRNYDWTEEQCDELFEDIWGLYTDNTREHYLGNIVYYTGNNQATNFNEYILIDGQQRITSILLLLCAIRDMLTSEYDKQYINTNCLINQNPNYINYAPVRIRQTSHDREVFEMLILHGNVQEQHNSSNIYKNYLEFKKLLCNHFNNDNNQPNDTQLNSFANSLLRLIVVDVNLQAANNLEAVQTIFEKINSTGKPLTPADLIRNYLLVSNNMYQQEHLYNYYWQPMENGIGANSITTFAKHYLIIKKKTPVHEDKIYAAFKEYCTESNREKETILDEMLRLSKYFKWLNEECCNDETINYRIQEFNALSAKDMYPLYIDLFDRLYDSNRNELKEIFKLLSDFLVRFRIAGKVQGGGALQSIVCSLLDLFESDDFELTANNIRIELSRNRGERKYPTDDEFKEALKSSRKVNHTYGKVVLRKIEDQNGTIRNIPIPLHPITVEHFMPQTLTPWWINNFGGPESASIVYDHYINCIGNLGIMSGPLNARNSNRPWPEKLRIIQNTQFSVTRVVSDIYPNWTENEIIQRNNELSDYAVRYVSGPAIINDDCIIRINGGSGIYPASDIETDLTGYRLVSYRFINTTTECTKWKTFWKFIITQAYNESPTKFSQMVDANLICKRTLNETTINGRAPIIVSSNVYPNGLLQNIARLGNTNYYYETCLSSERIRVYSKQVLDYFDLTDQVSYEVQNPNEE